MSDGPVLVVSAHAGDFVWRAGGAMALAASRGAPSGSPGASYPMACASTRACKAIRAAAGWSGL